MIQLYRIESAWDEYVRFGIARDGRYLRKKQRLPKIVSIHVYSKLFSAIRTEPNQAKSSQAEGELNKA